MRNWLLWMGLLPATGTAADPFVGGACTPFRQGKGLLKVHLSIMRSAGISSFRDEVVWRAIERTKGQYEMPPAWDEFVNEGRKTGIEPLLILDYGDRKSTRLNSSH